MNSRHTTNSAGATSSRRAAILYTAKSETKDCKSLGHIAADNHHSQGRVQVREEAHRLGDDRGQMQIQKVDGQAKQQANDARA